MMEGEIMQENKKDSQPIHVFIDTETTGLGHKDWREVREDAIVEIAFAYRINGKPRSQSWLCQPEKWYYSGDRATEAFKVSQISASMVNQAPRDYIIAQIARNKLYSLGNVVLHSYNIAFDRPFVEKEPWHFNFRWGDDPMELAQNEMKAERYPHLEDALNEFNILRHGHAHRAESDAIAAMEVWEYCIRKLNGVD